MGHDCRRVRSRRRHDATRLRCWQICSDSSRLSPTIVASSVHTADATQLDSRVASASAVCTRLEAVHAHQARRHFTVDTCRHISGPATTTAVETRAGLSICWSVYTHSTTLGPLHCHGKRASKGAEVRGVEPGEGAEIEIPKASRGDWKGRRCFPPPVVDPAKGGPGSRPPPLTKT